MLGWILRSKDVIKNDDSHAPLRVARDQACPFAAAGHDSGRVEDAFKSAAWGAVLVWWACWRDMFKLKFPSRSSESAKNEV